MTLKVINKINGKIKFLNRKNRYLTKEVRRMLWHALIPSHFDYVFFVFFLSKFSFIDTDDSQDNREREWLIFYSTLPLPPTHKHLDIYLQLCMFACEMTITYFQSHHLYLPDCYMMRFTTLSNYYLTDWWCEVSFCLFTWWFDNRFLLQHLDTGNRWTWTGNNYHPCITSELTNQES